MTIDLDKLEQLARAATPGPWRHRDANYQAEQLPGEEPDVYSRNASRTVCNPWRGTDGDYIAAANPATVLALIEEIARLQERVAEWKLGYDLLRDTVAESRIARALELLDECQFSHLGLGDDPVSCSEYAQTERGANWPPGRWCKPCAIRRVLKGEE